MWFRKAADQGYIGSQRMLGMCYANGWGVAKDQAEAVSWYRKAAEQGDTNAQISLGHKYNVGEGVTKDPVEAYAYWNLAGITDEGARRSLARLEKMISADQIATGKKRTNELQKEIEAKIAAKKASK
jgi:TPR repeat protein